MPAWAEHNFIEQEPVVRHISNRARLGEGAHGHSYAGRQDEGIQDVEATIQLDIGGYATAGEAGTQKAFSKNLGTTFCLLYAQIAPACGF